MRPDNLQLQRLELKYQVSETTALAVRDFVRAYLALDEYGEGKENFSYPIHSLYLDSDGLDLYWNTIGGHKNRYKLRVRYYDDNPLSPVFFEIKRRSNNAILKQRAAVHRNAVDWLLSGHFPEPGHVIAENGKNLVAVQRFLQLMQSVNAKPRAHIAYDREAWVSVKDNSVRVTMDRNIRGCPEPTTRLRTDIKNFVTPFREVVILELKFTGRFPVWFRDLVQAFNLRQSAAAKYADSITLQGEHLYYGSLWSEEMLAKSGQLLANRSRHHLSAMEDDGAFQLDASGNFK